MRIYLMVFLLCLGQSAFAKNIFQALEQLNDCPPGSASCESCEQEDGKITLLIIVQDDKKVPISGFKMTILGKEYVTNAQGEASFPTAIDVKIPVYVDGSVVQEIRIPGASQIPKEAQNSATVMRSVLTVSSGASGGKCELCGKAVLKVIVKTGDGSKPRVGQKVIINGNELLTDNNGEASTPVASKSKSKVIVPGYKNGQAMDLTAPDVPANGSTTFGMTVGFDEAPPEVIGLKIKFNELPETVPAEGFILKLKGKSGKEVEVQLDANGVANVPEFIPEGEAYTVQIGEQTLDGSEGGKPDPKDPDGGKLVHRKGASRIWTFSGATMKQVDLNILFDVNKADIKIKENQKLLDDLVKIVSENAKNKIEIIGHTDSDGDDVSNQKLSQARAEALKKYLLSKGIQAKNIKAIGMGEKQPKEKNDTPAHKAVNRRIEIKVLSLKLM